MTASVQILRIDSGRVHLVAPLFDRYRVFYNQPSDLALADRYLRARLDINESTIFAAMDGDAATGFVQLYPHLSSVRACRDWTLNDLFVEPEYRNRGIGRALVDKALDFSREQGATFLQLETAPDNYAAQALYEQIGFIKQPAPGQYISYKIDI
jgi:ribosomal protein S18 acetylase RimI-like enzyme